MLVDEGKPPTFSNLGRKLQRSGQAVQQLFARHPDLMPWIDSHVSAYNASFAGAVVRRAALLGIQGSREHQELYLKYCAGVFSRPDPAAPGDNQGAPGSSYTLNLLMCRPEYPVPLQAQEGPARLPPPDLPTRQSASGGR